MYENYEKSRLRRSDIVYPQLSYAINWALFSVFKELGQGYQEKYYQRAIAKEFQARSILFKEQVQVPLAYRQESIGAYFLDFLIDGKVVLEIKRGDYFRKHTIEQIVGYLRATKLQIGLIANFTQNGVKIRRILNAKNFS